MSDYHPEQPTHDENGIPLCRAYGCPLAGDRANSTVGSDYKLCSFHIETQPRFWAEVTTRIKKYKRVLDLLHDVHVNPLKWATRRVEYLDDPTYRQKADENQGQWLVRVRYMVRARILDGLDKAAKQENAKGIRHATEYLQQGGTLNTFEQPPSYSEAKGGE